MDTITLSVPAISCAHCAHTIKSELSALQGITSVEVDVNAKRVTIQFSAPATLQRIEHLLKEINYPPEM